MGLAEVLTIVFIVLKLTGVISWSWWLVLLPEIIAFSIYIIWFSIVSTIVLKTNKEFKKDSFFKRK